jgi:HD superfamily phosphohydrolase
MSPKIIRDPLYNYFTIERARDGWLLGLVDSPEVQRLRRIHQLGLSHLTFPGADHSRFSHSLGVLHVMMQVLDHLDASYHDAQVRRAREPLLAAALVHDVGHGPFSHLFEACLGTDHEAWSVRIILSPETGVNAALRARDPALPGTVAQLVDPANHEHPAWQKYLLSSQLDVDRLDYLRRDSLFTGAEYGHFDWYRLIHTLELRDNEHSGREIVWPEKSKFAIEEYIFARYYMYRTVYRHKTTSGFSKMVEAIWARARDLFDHGVDVAPTSAIRGFWSVPNPGVAEYLAIEEFTILHQIQAWVSHRDKSLADLSRRFLERKRFAMIEAPVLSSGVTPDLTEWEHGLRSLIGNHREYDPPEMYCLIDRIGPRSVEPYIPQKAGDQHSVHTAIRVRIDGLSQPVEVSELLPRLQPVTQETSYRVRYYIPKEVVSEASTLRAQWT